MGARVEGKVKKKSIKANVTSKFSSKRKLSRMGKKVKKGQMGPNTEYITRSSALKRLQITLKDFRRLCILKGIYPRVPSKGLKGNDKIYYDIKDISYIMHEPLLQKFREFKTFLKKIRKAAGRNQLSEARRKDELKPKITLNHLVKERYPRFIDALRDLDDALCMIHLFAALPSAGRVTAERTTLCSKLVKEWQYYVSKSRSLHKVFVSVKGVYFQAEILGEPVTWLVPHQFTQAVPKEVDLRVMLTFLEFYEIFMQFVLFKLYSMQNMAYPPSVDAQLDSAGCFLLAINDSKDDVTDNGSTVDNTAVAAHATDKVDANIQKKVTALVKNLEPGTDDEEEDELGQLVEPLSNAFSELRKNNIDNSNDDGVGKLERDTFHLSSDPRQRLFSGLVFFVNREVPLEWMQLCTVSFGAKVGWDGPMSPINASDPRITHHIIDRPQQAVSVTVATDNKKKGKRNASNAASSKDSLDQYPSREYIQPQWVFDSINAQILLPVANYRLGSTLPPHLSPFVDDEKEGYLPQYKEEIQKLQQQSNGTDTNIDSNDNSKDNVNSNNSDSDENSAGVTQETNPLEIQDTISSGKRGPKGVVFKPTESLSEGDEAAHMSQIMMSKKTKRLYGRMKHGIQQKQEKIETLKMKRQKQH